MDITNRIAVSWLYPAKKRLMLGLVGLLSLSIALAIGIVLVFLRTNLIEESARSAREVSVAILSSLNRLMFMRAPQEINFTLGRLVAGDGSILRAFIVDEKGRVAYSSHPNDVGDNLNRFQESSCRPCHQGSVSAPAQSTSLIEYRGEAALRSITVIYNEAACHECHVPTVRIIGKLIIDHSLRASRSLILKVEVILVLSGLLGLLATFPFVSRTVNRYIDQIGRQCSELNMLYLMVDRLSRTIDFEELKSVIIQLLQESFNAEEVDLVLPKISGGYTCFTWTKAAGKIVRKKLFKDDPMLPPIRQWLAGERDVKACLEIGSRLCLPIASASAPLVFIKLTKSAPFTEQHFRLMRAMGSHIGVAFENARLYYLAITDELSGLYSHRHFKYLINRRFSEFERSGEKFALLMLDLDDFKTVNDTHGHLTGDTVIKEFSRIVLESLRSTSDMAFRYGGEEIALILSDTDMPAALNVAERIRRTAEESVFDQAEAKLRVTVSIGAATCPASALTAKDLIVAADQALYVSKNSGKNRVTSATFMR